MKLQPLWVSAALCLLWATVVLAEDPPQDGKSPPTQKLAHETDAPSSQQLLSLFPWYVDSESPDWVTGVLYALLGLVGALITVFGLIGSAIPGTAGFANIEAGMKRVEEREKILDKLIKDSERNPEEIKAVEIATNNLRDDLREDRRRQFGLAAGLYTVLGAFFAAMLARDLLQAILIGAGWTASFGALGLKKDYAQRKIIKDEATERLESAVEQAKKGSLTDSDYEDLRVEALVSKAL
jgi:hypothetical protein